MSITMTMDSFWRSTAGNVPFKLFSSQHLTALGIILGLLILMVLHKDQLRVPETREKVGRLIGCILLFQTFFLHFWFIQNGTFTLQESLPFYLCRISVILSIIMTWKGSYNVFEVVYFWGLAGATQALLTPDVSGFTFPHWMYIQFFVSHGGIVIAVFFMILAYDYRPTFHSLKKAYKYSMLYLVSISVINHLIHANYSYLSGKPPTSTVLDYLPAYPYYVPIMVIGLLVICFMLYLPYMIKDIKIKHLINSI